MGARSTLLSLVVLGWPRRCCATGCRVKRFARTSPRSSRRSAKLPPARFDRADVARHVSKRRGPWARSIKSRVAARQMPPWHIDKTVGIQEFENDRSLSDRADRHHRRRGSTPARRRAIRRTCRPARCGRASRAGTSPSMFGQKEPDLIIQSTPWTQKAAPTTRGGSPSSRPALTEPRWVRAIEIRPEHRQGPQDHASRDRAPAAERNRSARAESRRRRTAIRRPARSWNGPSASRARSMRPNSGKLMLPGSKIVWDIHYSNGGEDITDDRRARHLLLSEGPGAEVPPGAAPDGRHQRHGVSALGTRSTSAQHRQGDRRLLPAARERAASKLPAAHAPARQGDVDGSDPAERPDRRC